MHAHAVATLQFDHSVPRGYDGIRGRCDIYRLSFPDWDGRMTTLALRMDRLRKKQSAIPLDRRAHFLVVRFRDWRVQRLLREERRLEETIAGAVRRLLRSRGGPRFSLAGSDSEKYSIDRNRRLELANKLETLQLHGTRGQVNLWVTHPKAD